MRVAVTGASGFIGRYVVRELLSHGIDVVGVARTIAGWQSPPLWTEIDISKPPIDLLDKLGNPDALIHLAWDGLPNYDSPHHTESEYPAHLNFLKQCLDQGLRKLYVAGTCYEYGLASGELTEETPARPCTKYGLAKTMLHEALLELQKEHLFQLTWFRLFYLYGEGQSESSLYSSLRSAIKSGEANFPMSGGAQLRDFLPVEVAAKMMVSAVLQENAQGTFNVCSGIPVSVQSIVRRWVECENSNINLILGHYPYSKHESMEFWGSRCKLNLVLGII